MISVTRLGLVGCLLLGLAACSSSPFRDRNSDYYLAQAAHNPLPSEYQQQDVMPLQPAGQLTKAQKKLPRPEAQLSYTEPEQLVQLREETPASNNWLLVNRSPAEVWPALREYAEQNNLEIVKSQPSQGQLTLLASNNQPLEVSLRQGVRQASSEVRLSSTQQLAAVQAFLQEQLLSRASGISMQAQNLQTQTQVFLQDRDTRQVLVLQLDFARAWAELSYLLEEEAKARDWLEVTDLNRSEGRFYIQYIPKEQRPAGFFSRLFKPKPKLKNYNFQLVLTSYSQELDLIVETEPGVAATPEIEQEILAWLEHQLR